MFNHIIETRMVKELTFFFIAKWNLADSDDVASFNSSPFSV